MPVAQLSLTTLNGDTTLIAAQANRRIRVNAYNITGVATGTYDFLAGAGGASLGGLMRFAGSAKNICAPRVPGGWFSTPIGVALNCVVTGAGAEIYGTIDYSVV